MADIKATKSLMVGSMVIYVVIMDNSLFFDKCQANFRNAADMTIIFSDCNIYMYHSLPA